MKNHIFMLWKRTRIRQNSYIPISKNSSCGFYKSSFYLGTEPNCEQRDLKTRVLSKFGKSKNLPETCCCFRWRLAESGISIARWSPRPRSSSTSTTTTTRHSEQPYRACSPLFLRLIRGKKKVQLCFNKIIITNSFLLSNFLLVQKVEKIINFCFSVEKQACVLALELIESDLLTGRDMSEVKKIIVDLQTFLLETAPFRSSRSTSCPEELCVRALPSALPESSTSSTLLTPNPSDATSLRIQVSSC